MKDDDSIHCDLRLRLFVTHHKSILFSMAKLLRVPVTNRNKEKFLLSLRKSFNSECCYQQRCQNTKISLCQVTWKINKVNSLMSLIKIHDSLSSQMSVVNKLIVKFDATCYCFIGYLTSLNRGQTIEDDKRKRRKVRGKINWLNDESVSNFYKIRKSNFLLLSPVKSKLELNEERKTWLNSESLEMTEKIK